MARPSELRCTARARAGLLAKIHKATVIISHAMALGAGSFTMVQMTQAGSIRIGTAGCTALSTANRKATFRQNAALKSKPAATPPDDLLVRRLKKRKLLLKDRIALLEHQLEPDALA